MLHNYTCMFCNMNTTVVLIITLLFKFPTVYLKPSITIESCICFPMITLVLDNVTYYYNTLILAISIYLDKPHCKSLLSLDFRHTKLCIKRIPLIRGGSRMVGALRQTTWWGPLRRST